MESRQHLKVECEDAVEEGEEHSGTRWSSLSYTKLYSSILTRLNGSIQNAFTKVYKVIQKTHVSTFAKMASISDIDMICMRGLLNTWWSEWGRHTQLSGRDQ